MLLSCWGLCCLSVLSFLLHDAFCIRFCTSCYCSHWTFSPLPLHPLLRSTRYLRVPGNVIASEKQTVYLELITAFPVFLPHFALVSFIAISFGSAFYLFMSHALPGDLHLHTLCRKLLKDSHPVYPNKRTS